MSMFRLGVEWPNEALHQASLAGQSWERQLVRAPAGTWPLKRAVRRPSSLVKRRSGDVSARGRALGAAGPGMGEALGAATTTRPPWLCSSAAPTPVP
jgi:hypothetical protein